MLGQKYVHIQVVQDQVVPLVVDPPSDDSEDDPNGDGVHAADHDDVVRYGDSDSDNGDRRTPWPEYGDADNDFVDTGIPPNSGAANASNRQEALNLREEFKKTRLHRYDNTPRSSALRPSHSPERRPSRRPFADAGKTVQLQRSRSSTDDWEEVKKRRGRIRSEGGNQELKKRHDSQSHRNQNVFQKVHVNQTCRQVAEETEVVR